MIKHGTRSTNQAEPALTAARLREVLRYDPLTGICTWLVRAAHRRWPGEEAGSPSKDGRIRIRIDGELFYRYRLAFLYMTGAWPTETVDHINGDRTDDRWSNLRDVSQAVNSQNHRRAPRHSTTGLLGAQVCGDRFASSITLNNRVFRLGTFDTAEEAHKAYVMAKRAMHPGSTI